MEDWLIFPIFIGWFIMWWTLEDIRKELKEIRRHFEVNVEEG